MPGGLIQLVSLGSNDLFLTGNPQITFFKIVYRKYTNFSMQTFELPFDSVADFGKSVSCTIPTNGDLIYKSFLKIELPTVEFIKLKNYFFKKNNNESTIIYLKNEIEKKKKNIDVLTNYSNYIIDVYKIVIETIEAENVLLDGLKEKVKLYNSQNIEDITKYSSLIESNINSDTNIINYIINYDKYSDNFREIIKNNVDSKYNKLLKYNKQHFMNLKKQEDELNNVQEGSGNFAWNKFLGQFIYSDFELEIGGRSIEKRTSYWNHINTLINQKETQKEIYNKLIGNVSELTDFNNQNKPSYTLLIPLNFTFCNYPGSALPLIAMRYQNVNININFNNINNCCHLENIEELYNNLRVISYTNIFYIEDKLIDNDNYNLYFKNLKYNKEFNDYTYTFNYINVKILKNKYNFKEDKISYILNNYGSIKDDSEKNINQNINQNTLNLIEFNKMINSEDDNIKDIFINLNNSIDSEIKKNILNSIHFNNASLLVDYIYLDNVERQKFAQSNHEYLIEQVYSNTLELKNFNSVYLDLSFLHPIKEMFWFLKPDEYINNTKLLNESKYYNFTNNYFEESKISNNPIKTSQLEINNIKLFFDKNSYIFQYLEPYKSYTNSFPLGVNGYSFALFPNEYQPSGSFNFTSFKSKILRLSIDEEYYNKYNNNDFKITLFVHVSSYNILKIMNGIAKVVYN
jgi:hypothetical protein